MFCDMVGSSALSTRLDPEEQRDVVSTFQSCCAAEIKRLGGMVAQYLGDGVLAYFGYPAAHEDDAERAVRAGLAILGAVNSAATSVRGVRLEARIGIATGIVVVGDLVREGAMQENAAIGETTNLAARLQTMAEPGTLLICPETHRLLGVLFDYHDLGRHDLKGFVRPVHVHQVTGASKVENRFEARHPSGASPILGREEELELLLRRWEQAKRGRGRVALLIGEPGIGKSRLTRAADEQLASEQHIALWYHCSPYHQDSALYPIIGQLMRAASIEHDDEADLRLEKLEALIGRSNEQPRDDVPLIAALLSIPGGERYPLPKLSPQQMKERTLSVLLSHYEQLAEQQPLLMVFEDLHWIDPTSLELLTRVVELVPKLRVLVLATARPEFSAPWPNYEHILTLALNRLDRTNVQALVTAITGGKALPREVLDQIAERTDGVPLFIEELTKTILESGILREASDRFELTGQLPPLAIPSTLQASLVARLDRLASVKDVAQIGAVIGREFPHALLAAVAALPEKELRAAVSQLVEAGLIFRHGNPPNATYQFKHALVQDAAYESLIRSRRHLLHARVAEALAIAQIPRHHGSSTDPESSENPLDAPPGMIAFHFQAAQLPERALPFHKIAAERASSWGIHEEALQHYSAGLSCLEQLNERSSRSLDMVVGNAHALHFLGKRVEAMALLDRHATLLDQIADDAWKCRYFRIRGHIQSFLGNRIAARESYERALALGRSAGDDMLVAEANSSLGLELQFAGDMQRSSQYYKHAAETLRDKGDSTIYGWTLVHWSLCLIVLGRISEARELARRGAAMGQRLSDPTVDAHSAYALAQCHREIGEFNIALDLLNGALRKAANPFDEAMLSVEKAVALRHTAGKEIALSALRAALTKAKQYRSVQVQVNAMTQLAEGLIQHEELNEARTVIDDALKIASSIQAKLLVARLWTLGGRLALKSGEFATAEKLLTKALAVFENSDARLRVAWTKADLFSLHRAKGNNAIAETYLDSARAIFKEIDAPIHVAQLEKLAAETE
jgi:class 3 adenylate cyclase/tetratricopeptide (TPR) repeat protein